MNFDQLKDQHKKFQSRLDQINDKWFLFKQSRMTIWEAFHTKGFYEALVEQNYSNARQAFSDCAYTDIHYFNLFQGNVSNLFSAGRRYILTAVLSDNQQAIEAYAKIDYAISVRSNKYKMFSELVLKGDYVYCDIMIRAMHKDMDGLARDIEVIKKFCLPKKKNAWMKIDLDFFEAILHKDKDGALQAINKLLEKKEHKSRNRHSWFFKDLISQPALGYAKIAWMHGLELEFDSPFMINELLPIHPNSIYEDNIKTLYNNMTLDSKKEGYNGMKLAEDEYNLLYKNK